MASAKQIYPPDTLIPPDLRNKLPDGDIPWKINDRIMGEMKTQNGDYKKVQVLPLDPEWDFVWDYFYQDAPVLWEIGRIFCIHERHQMQAFELNLSSQEREADTFLPTWESEPRAEQRKNVMQRWERMVSQFSPFKTMETVDGDIRVRKWEKTKVLPLWHGTKAKICESIARSGFIFFGKESLSGKSGSSKSTDEGYFGSGIYFTNSARYAADIYSRWENGAAHMLLSWVSMRPPFPFVGDISQEDMKTFKGKGLHDSYNAHYIPVSPKTKTHSCPEYLPCQPHETPYCDEFVVPHKAQTIPRFWVEMKRSDFRSLEVAPKIPKHVDDLSPHILAMLQIEAVRADKKALKALKLVLEQLLQLPGDNYLKAHAFTHLYPKLQMLVQNGEVVTDVAKILLDPNAIVPLPESTSAPKSAASQVRAPAYQGNAQAQTIAEVSGAEQRQMAILGCDESGPKEQVALPLTRDPVQPQAQLRPQVQPSNMRETDVISADERAHTSSLKKEASKDLLSPSNPQSFPPSNPFSNAMSSDPQAATAGPANQARNRAAIEARMKKESPGLVIAKTEGKVGTLEDLEAIAGWSFPPPPENGKRRSPELVIAQPVRRPREQDVPSSERDLPALPPRAYAAKISRESKHDEGDSPNTTEVAYRQRAAQQTCNDHFSAPPKAAKLLGATNEDLHRKRERDELRAQVAALDLGDNRSGKLSIKKFFSKKK